MRFAAILSMVRPRVTAAAMLTTPATPRNGLLSGMILTWGSGLILLAAGLLSSAVRARFDHPPGADLTNALGVSILLMAAHKAESYFTGEFDVCPVYLTNGEALWCRDPRSALFVGFVTTFLGMMGVVWALLLGGPWPLLLLGVWVAQGAHEWHHLGKSLARRAYYPGTVTGVLFVGLVGLWYFPAWSAALALDSWILVAWGAAQPVILALFYLEDRAWLRKLSPEAAERIAPRAGLSGVAQPG